LGLIIKPIKTRKKFEEIVDQITLHIDQGYLKPGEKLPSERELVERFNVSRGSIREAFSALEMMGLIEVRTGEGSYVCQKKDIMTDLFQGNLQEKETFLEFLEVRKMLEVEAVGYAAKRVTDGDLEELKKELNSMESYINNPGTAWEKSNHSFHFDIAKAAHNKLAINLMNNIANYLENQIRIFSPLPYADKYSTEVLHQEHMAIFEAIAERNVEEARTRMHKHLSGLESVLIKKINIA